MTAIITTDRLTLRTGTETDAGNLLRFYDENRQEFEKYDPVLSDQFYTEQYHRSMLLYEQQQIASGQSMHYYVYEQGKPEQIIGNIDFFRIRPNPFFSTVLSYRFHHAYWGRGYASEAIASAIERMFADYPIHRIEARISTDNDRSIRLIERLHFTYEGIEHESVKIQGSFRDHLRYALLSVREI